MYVTMNRFKIKPEFADAYIQVWKDAGVRTKDVDGFLEFKFFRLEQGRRLRALFLLCRLGKQGKIPRLDEVRTFPQVACDGCGEPRDVC